jgi:hypothetical protein
MIHFFLLGNGFQVPIGFEIILMAPRLEKSLFSCVEGDFVCVIGFNVIFLGI